MQEGRNANSVHKTLAEGRNTNPLEKNLGDHLNPVLDVNMSSILYDHHIYVMMWQGAPHLRSAVPSNHKKYSSELGSTVLWRILVGADETDNPPKNDQRRWDMPEFSEVSCL